MYCYLVLVLVLTLSDSVSLGLGLGLEDAGLGLGLGLDTAGLGLGLGLGTSGLDYKTGFVCKTITQHQVISSLTHTTPCLKKLCKLIFCQNHVKFRPIVKILGRKIANSTGFLRCTHLPPHLICVNALPC